MAAEVTSKQKERVQFDFSQEVQQKLETIIEKTDSATRAEVVRRAIKLYYWLVNDVDPDNTLKIFDKNSDAITIVKVKQIL